jgi:hypothetical protein
MEEFNHIPFGDSHLLTHSFWSKVKWLHSCFQCSHFAFFNICVKTLDFSDFVGRESGVFYNQVNRHTFHFHHVRYLQRTLRPPPKATDIALAKVKNIFGYSKEIFLERTVILLSL